MGSETKLPSLLYKNKFAVRQSEHILHNKKANSARDELKWKGPQRPQSDALSL